MFSHKETSAFDPVELCACLTSAVDKRRSAADRADQFGQTPLHLAARRGAGVCAVHLIQVVTSTFHVLTRTVKVARTRLPSIEVPELVPVLGSQPTRDESHKPGGRLPLLSARPAF